MSLTENTLREFSEHVLRGDYIRAKSLIEKLEKLNLSEYERGCLDAMKGIISVIKDSGSNSNLQLSENFTKNWSLKFEEFLKLGSPMIDDYDKGFFECWCYFLKRL